MQFRVLSFIAAFLLISTVILSIQPTAISVEAQNDPTATLTITPTLDPDLPATYRIEQVVSAAWPIAVDWTPDGRLIFYRAVFRQFKSRQH